MNLIESLKKSFDEMTQMNLETLAKQVGSIVGKSNESIQLLQPILYDCNGLSYQLLVGFNASGALLIQVDNRIETRVLCPWDEFKREDFLINTALHYLYGWEFTRLGTTQPVMERMAA